MNIYGGMFRRPGGGGYIFKSTVKYYRTITKSQSNRENRKSRDSKYRRTVACVMCHVKTCDGEDIILFMSCM